MFNLATTAPLSLFISLAALTGVSVHDTKIDKLTTSMVGVPAMMSNTESGSKSLSSDPHTHVERVSVKDVQSSQPRLMPRSDHKKHLLQKNAPKGANRFDGYVQPLR